MAKNQTVARFKKKLQFPLDNSSRLCDYSRRKDTSMKNAISEYLAFIGGKGGRAKVAKGFSTPAVQAKAQATRQAKRKAAKS